MGPVTMATVNATASFQFAVVNKGHDHKSFNNVV